MVLKVIAAAATDKTVAGHVIVDEPLETKANNEEQWQTMGNNNDKQ